MTWLAAAAVLTAVPISFDDAFARVDQAPDLEGTRAAAQARREGLAKLGWFTSNPQLTLLPGIRHEGSNPGAEVGLSISQSFNLGGLAGARRAVAAEEAAEAEVMRAHALQLRRLEVARAWLDTWTAQQATEATRAEEVAARAMQTTLERALASGAVTTVDVATSRAFAAEAIAARLDWEGRRVEAGALLASLLGLAEIASAAGALPAFEVAALSADPSAFASVRAAAATLNVEVKRADETRALWAPQLHLSLQGGHEAPRLFYGVVGVGVTLPLLERGEREHSSQTANQQRLAGLAQQATRAAQIEAQVVRHDLEHAEETFAVVHDIQWPAAEEAVRQETRRHQQGEATLLELTMLRRQALAAHVAALLAEANLAAARIRAHTLLEATRTNP